MSNLGTININNELKSNYYENNNFNIPQNNFININNMNSKPNYFFFNKSQLSVNSMHSLNNSNRIKPNNLKMNQKNINGKNNHNKMKNNEKYILMIKSQKGSKAIQKKIEEKHNEFTSGLYEQIKNNLFEIINDQYGNYVMQKFADNCDKKILSLMLKKLYCGTNNTDNNFKNYLYEISINPYGTRALQKILENLGNSMTEEDINIILKFTKGNIYQMIKDINGNHVIQSIIENIKKKIY